MSTPTFNLIKEGSKKNYKKFVRNIRGITRRHAVYDNDGHLMNASINDIDVKWDQRNRQRKLHLKMRTQDFYILGYTVDTGNTLWEMKKTTDTNGVLAGSQALGFGVRYEINVATLLQNVSYPSFTEAVATLIRTEDPLSQCEMIQKCLLLIILMTLEAARFEWIRNTFSYHVVRGVATVPKWVTAIIRKWRKYSCFAVEYMESSTFSETFNREDMKAVNSRDTEIFKDKVNRGKYAYAIVKVRLNF